MNGHALKRPNVILVMPWHGWLLSLSTNPFALG
jgi:hypothetical protein